MERILRRLGKTPKELGTIKKDCDGGSCPDILETIDGNFIIIGTDVTNNVDLAGIAGIGPDEKAILIPRVTMLAAKKDIP